jgi:glycosyltransferase involved in cell wall biosynthesis
MTATLAVEEPTQASIRALLQEWTDGPLPAGGAPLQSELEEEGEGEGAVVADRRAVHVSNPPAGPAPSAGPVSPRVAYLLPGLPPEGSGGSHSLVQEARGLRALGARAWVCVPEDSLARAAALYGQEDGLFVPYPVEEPVLPGVSGAAVEGALAEADVAVATEYPSVDLLARLRRARPHLGCAYYVQDYEPLFAAPESSRADRALLSYRALPDQLLFAKTHWLRGVVGAIHGVPVAKVRPSLDRTLFHALGRTEHEALSARERPLRVAAMIRPRTPRRRPAATLRALALAACELDEDVRIDTFGCDEDSFAQLDGHAAPVRHHGLLTRAEVGELMRSSDVFLDGSAYQAFGRTGLEAMACGAVPLLPALGGVHEYARHDDNAVILADGSPEEMAGAILALARDPARLARLRAAGVATADGYSVERAARSQLDLFATALALRAQAGPARASTLRDHVADER